MVLNINTDAAVIFSNQLEKMSRSALPVAVRTALNSAAFDVKKNTLPASASHEFIKRSPNFFKANSRVQMAQGFDVNNMRSVIGMVEGGLKGGSNYAVKNLEQQEYGGTIKGRDFVPVDDARQGGNYAKSVRPMNRMSGLNKVVNAKKAKGANDKQKFVKSALFAGAGGLVIAKYKEKTLLWRVNSINRTREGAFKLTLLYDYTDNRNIKVEGTGFMKKASLKSAAELELYFIKAAEKQIAKLAS